MHLHDFETSAVRFRDAYTNVVGTHEDSKTGRAINYFRSLPIASFELMAIAGDTIQNLRSALDQLAFQLVDAAQATSSNASLGERRSARISFPIAENATHYQAARGKIKGTRKPAIEAIDALKPYRGGNPILWGIQLLA